MPYSETTMKGNIMDDINETEEMTNGQTAVMIALLTLTGIGAVAVGIKTVEYGSIIVKGFREGWRGGRSGKSLKTPVEETLESTGE